ncbi:hypothetical protein [Pseudomonas palleroniana]
MNDELFLLANQKRHTNHVLHLILTICTGGFWVVAWILVANSNNRHNIAIDKKMRRIVDDKVAGETDTEEQESIRDGDPHKAKVLMVVVALIVLVVYLKSR